MQACYSVCSAPYTCAENSYVCCNSPWPWYYDFLIAFCSIAVIAIVAVALICTIIQKRRKIKIFNQTESQRKIGSNYTKIVQKDPQVVGVPRGFLGRSISRQQKTEQILQYDDEDLKNVKEDE